jgi:two-component system cell cycle sensor histidine kinase/response regulator CckA
VTHAELAAAILAAASQGGALAADGTGVPVRALLATSGLCVALVFVVRRAVPWLQARRERHVTALLEAAQRARQARQQARESEDRVRLLLDSTVEAICGLDLDGLVTFCNPAAVRILGLAAPEQLLGRSFYGMARLPDAGKALPAVWSEAAVHTYARLEQELQLRRGDGSLVPVQHSAAAMLRQGKLVGRVVTFLDITERKRAEEALRKSQAQLRMADRLATVGTLSAGVAHEINNPLAYTLANLAFVRDALMRLPDSLPGVDVPELRASIAEANEGAERVRRIVKDMKVLSRMDDDRIGVVDVEAALDASLNMAIHELRHRAQVVKDYGRVPLVRCNEGRLVQVFLNLLVNASQAITGNAPERNEVRLATCIDGRGQIAVEISDTGMGIPEEVLPRIFDPFFTTKPVGVGTGLGLSICHSLITAMGGAIEVASKVGVGTRFLIVLPAAGT